MDMDERDKRAASVTSDKHADFFSAEKRQKSVICDVKNCSKGYRTFSKAKRHRILSQPKDVNGAVTGTYSTFKSSRIVGHRKY